MLHASPENALSGYAASQLIDDFAHSYGPAATLLIAHAAVAETLRADLVALMRKNFIVGPQKKNASLDADVLYGPLTDNLGGGYFNIDGEIRRQLIMLLNAWGARRIESDLRSKHVAKFIRSYVAHKSKRISDDLEYKAFLNKIHWSAVAFDTPEVAVNSLFRNMVPAIRDLEKGNAQVRFSGLLKVLALPMPAYFDELNFAETVDILSHAEDEQHYQKARSLIEHIQDQTLSSQSVSLPKPREVLEKYRSRLDEVKDYVAINDGHKNHNAFSAECTSEPMGVSSPPYEREQRPISGQKNQAIHRSVRDNDIAQVKKILADDIGQLNARGKYGRSAVHLAAGWGHLALLRELLASGGEVNKKDDDGAYPLWLAAHCGHSASVKELLNHGAEVNAGGFNGVSPISVATYNGYEDIVQLLLSNGADVDQADDFGISALENAARTGRKKIFDLLFQQSKNIFGNGNNGQTLLQAGCFGGCISIVKILLKHNFDIGQPDSTGWTPLRAATYGGHADIVALLLELGANPHSVNRSWTLVHLCSQQKNTLFLPLVGDHARTIKCLREYGAEIEIPLPSGDMPLHIAVHHNAIDVLLTLLDFPEIDLNRKNGQGLSPLMLAVSTNAAEAVAALLARPNVDTASLNNRKDILDLAIDRLSIIDGKCAELDMFSSLISDERIDFNRGDPPALWELAKASQKIGNYDVFDMVCDHPKTILDWKNKNGEQLLHQAAALGQYDIVVKLLKKNVGIDELDASGESPLYKSVVAQKEMITKYLLEAGASTNITSLKTNFSILEAAVKANDYMGLLRLIEAGVDINVCNPRSGSLLHIAAKSAGETICELLIKQGLAIEGVDSYGMRPLLYAIQSGDTKKIDMFIRADADKSASNDDGWGALHFAAQNNLLELTKGLLRDGVDKERTTRRPQKTPLQIAVEAEAKDAVEVLITFNADLNRSTDDCPPPAILAIKYGHYALALRLIHLGADVNIVDPISQRTSFDTLNTRAIKRIQDGEKESDIEHRLRTRLCKGTVLFKNRNEMHEDVPLDASRSKSCTRWNTALLQNLHAHDVDDPVGDPWTMIPVDQKQELINLHDLSSDDNPWESDQVQIAWRYLPFYRSTVLLRVRHTEWRGSNSARYYLVPRSAKALNLNVGSQVIHHVNAIEKLRLTRSNVCDYLRFFNFFVRHSEHPYYLVDAASDPGLNSIEDGSLREAIKAGLKPLRIIYNGEVESDGFALVGTLIHGEYLVKATFDVSSNGTVRMAEHVTTMSALNGLANLPII